MKRHICERCRILISEDLTNYPNKEIIIMGICSSCSMKPEDKFKLKRDAQTWRDKKKKEILNKKNPTKMDKEMIKLWDKNEQQKI